MANFNQIGWFDSLSRKTRFFEEEGVSPRTPPECESGLDYFANPQTLVNSDKQKRLENSVTRLFAPSTDDLKKETLNFADIASEEAKGLEILAGDLGFEFDEANITDRLDELSSELHKDGLSKAELAAINGEIEVLYGLCAALKGALVEYREATNGALLAVPEMMTAAYDNLQAALKLLNEFSIKPSAGTLKELGKAGNDAAKFIAGIGAINAATQAQVIGEVFSGEDLAAIKNIEDPIHRASMGLALIEKFYESVEIPDIAKSRPELILERMSKAGILDAATLKEAGFRDLPKGMLMAGERIQNGELTLENGIEEVKGFLSQAAFNKSKELRDGMMAELVGTLYKTANANSDREEQWERYKKEMASKANLIHSLAMPESDYGPSYSGKDVSRWRDEFEKIWASVKEKREEQWKVASGMAIKVTGIEGDINKVEGTRSFAELLDKQANISAKLTEKGGNRSLETLFEATRCAHVYLSGRALAENLSQDPGMRQVSRAVRSEFTEKDFVARLEREAPLGDLTKEHIVAMRGRFEGQIGLFEAAAKDAEFFNGIFKFSSAVGIIMLAAMTGGVAAGAAADLGLVTQGGIGAFFIDSTVFGLTDMAISGATPWDSYPKTGKEFAKKMVHTYATFGALRGTGKILGKLRGDAELGWKVINDAERFAAGNFTVKEMRAVTTALGSNISAADAILTDALQILNAHATLTGASAGLALAGAGEMPQGIGSWEDLLTLAIVHVQSKYNAKGREKMFAAKRSEPLQTQDGLATAGWMQSARSYMRWAGTLPAHESRSPGVGDDGGVFGVLGAQLRKAEARLVPGGKLAAGIDGSAERAVETSSSRFSTPVVKLEGVPDKGPALRVVQSPDYEQIEIYPVGRADRNKKIDDIVEDVALKIERGDVKGEIKFVVVDDGSLGQGSFDGFVSRFITRLYLANGNAPVKYEVSIVKEGNPEKIVVYRYDFDGSNGRNAIFVRATDVKTQDGLDVVADRVGKSEVREDVRIVIEEGVDAKIIEDLVVAARDRTTGKRVVVTDSEGKVVLEKDENNLLSRTLLSNDDVTVVKRVAQDGKRSFIARDNSGREILRADESKMKIEADLGAEDNRPAMAALSITLEKARSESGISGGWELIVRTGFGRVNVAGLKELIIDNLKASGVLKSVTEFSTVIEKGKRVEAETSYTVDGAGNLSITGQMTQTAREVTLEYFGTRLKNAGTGFAGAQIDKLLSDAMEQALRVQHDTSFAKGSWFDKWEGAVNGLIKYDKFAQGNPLRPSAADVYGAITAGSNFNGAVDEHMLRINSLDVLRVTRELSAPKQIEAVFTEVVSMAKATPNGVQIKGVLVDAPFKAELNGYTMHGMAARDELARKNEQKAELERRIVNGEIDHGVVTSLPTADRSGRGRTPDMLILAGKKGVLVETKHTTVFLDKKREPFAGVGEVVRQVRNGVAQLNDRIVTDEIGAIISNARHNHGNKFDIVGRAVVIRLAGLKIGSVEAPVIIDDVKNGITSDTNITIYLEFDDGSRVVNIGKRVSSSEQILIPIEEAIADQLLKVNP